MSDTIKEMEDNILMYLYESRLQSPQSLTKIKAAVQLGNGKGDIRIAKTCIEALIEKNFIKKQESRGNYKIEDNGIAYIEENKERA